MVDILDEMDELRDKFQELEEMMGDPEIIDSNRYEQVSQNYSKLKKILEHAEEISKLDEEIESSQEMLETEEDPDMIELIKEDIQENKEERKERYNTIKDLLLPPNPSEEKNAILEIRAGAGGDESSLFAADLLRMYKRFAEQQGWEVEALGSHPTPIGGFKEVTVAVEGEGVFGKF